MSDAVIITVLGISTYLLANFAVAVLFAILAFDQSLSKQELREPVLWLLVVFTPVPYFLYVAFYAVRKFFKERGIK